MDRVTSADLVRNFGTWQCRALQAPIIVTHRGRDTHLLTSYQAGIATGGSETGWNDLFDDMVEAVVIVDSSLQLVRTNRAARVMLGEVKQDEVPISLEALAPGLNDALVERYIARTMRTGEPFAGDVQSPFREDGWLRLKIVKTGDAVALIFRDVTDELSAFALMDVKAAIIKSIQTLGHLGYARLTVRGMVERIDTGLCDMLGVNEEAARRVAFASLVPSRGRSTFNEVLDRVIQTGVAEKLDSELIDRSGTAIPVCLAVTQVMGLYAPEGAVVLISWDR